ncbi:MAG TPA: hypothetical protein EYP41_02775 [Anaerolineae bacterium]|nr:hypothetical protein [Anaerolineae bacterium]
MNEFNANAQMAIRREGDHLRVRLGGDWLITTAGLPDLDEVITLLEIVMREGRKRQIRRIASMLGYPVKQLVREKIGPLSLGKLRSGDWRYLTASEVKILRETVSKGGKRTGKKRYKKQKKTKK